MIIILNVFLSILFAELVSGIFHWWEDRYGNPDWPIIGKFIIEPNIRHHQYPTEFCKGSYLYRNSSTLIPTLAAAAIFYWQPVICLGFILMSQSNEIHSWSHQKCSYPIRMLQKIGIVQSPQQHYIHHKRPYDRYYCVMTNYFNPILSYLKFWQILEAIVYIFTGIKPRKEREIF